ncbi:hypothetical protein [Novosphingobium olei]|uniref:hypothetical protein n=1 Tax=Novosphingobium olei TaxID=2728851 RepID=UPI0030937AF8|nr:hypothetical protein NSDW_11570 [Novosphingobium olei]
MMLAGQLAVVVNRWQPGRVDLDFVGYDFASASFRAQVRAYRDAPDPALITLANAAAGEEGVSVSVTTTDGVPTSTVTLLFADTTIRALPFTNPRGTDLQLVWDLTVTAPGGLKTRWLEGPFTIHGGSTQL